MPIMKYIHQPTPIDSPVPIITLNPPHSGVIQTVGLYQGKDFLRGNEYRGDYGIQLDLETQQLGRNSVFTLERMTDEDLEHVVFQAKLLNKWIPVSELKEIRTLQRRLRREMGNYRSRE